ncbi:ABC1 kinase family protein [Streptosporangium carneum]|uniref:Ubiquinone biosynthesis protein UbiB n=1 Tax=Streptosporangium carneum TaxID=47481 RepID=A0A9W6HYY6_9ACTN|nr:AarF/UbiB family protein [Streptosporangium carneum]GLK08643.1 ubiquinone biosynthesis protein UbiB [Streptosporangium carneum]
MPDLLTLIAPILNALLVALIARKALGVPVGWPRSIAMGLFMGATVAWAAGYISELTGVYVDGQAKAPLGVLFVVAALVTAWVFVIGLIVLVLLELFVPTGTLPSPLTFLRGWKARRSRARRYTQVMRIAAKHGLSGYLGGRRRAHEGQAAIARSLRDALNEGGVTFVKLGQMLSTRRDLIPEVFANQLATLQTRAEPEPWPQIERAIEEELGAPLGQVFLTVDSSPLASASVAQVHAARLLDGTPVVLKVQRPGARKQVTSDVEIILRLGRWLERATPWGGSLRVSRLAEGFAASLDEELDYTVELDNLRGIAATLDGGVRVPTAHGAHSTGRLLVMDRLEGTPIGDAGALLATLPAATRKEIAERLLSEILRQLVRTGVFHADLHPGNVLVTADGSLGLLDFGSVGRLDQPTRNALGMLLLAIDKNDAIGATDSLIEMLDRPEGLAERELERDIGQLMVRYRTGLGRGGSSGMFAALFKLIHAYGFAVPPQIAGAFRALAALDGTLTLISPDLDVVGAARRQGREMMREVTEPEAVRADLESRLAGYLPILQRLPRRINKLAEDLEHGRISINIRPLSDERDRRFLTGLVHQVVVAILAATATLGAIVLLASDIGPMVTPSLRLFALIGFALLLVGFVLALRSLALVFRRQ